MIANPEGNGGEGELVGAWGACLGGLRVDTIDAEWETSDETPVGERQV